MEGLGAAFDTPEMEEYRRMAKYSQIYQIIKLVCNLLVIPATILMWKLKKAGFFIYLVVQAGPIIMYIVLIRAFTLWGFFGWLWFIPDAVSVAFIIMYGLNLKYMK